MVNACVRVVVPAHSAMSTIRNCVEAIVESTTVSDLEVVVVDDGKNPGLEDALDGLRAEIRRTGDRRSAAVARNLGAQGFEDGVLVFIDADVIIHRRTILNLVKPILLGDVSATVGNYSSSVEGLSFASRYKQLYISKIYSRTRSVLRNDFWTAIGAVRAKTFHRLSGFDVTFSGACGEDGEFGARLTVAGEKICSVPQATGDHRHDYSVPGLILNDWRKGRVALANRSRCRGQLSDNRHATPRDAVAVAFLGLVLVTGALAPWISAWPAALCLFAYLAARADLLRRFALEGIWFLLRAFGLMMVLDLVRGFCVGSVLGSIRHKSPTFDRREIRHA